MPTAEDLIRHLRLQPHPKEGGHFRETYRASEQFSAPGLPERYRGPRSASTAIYYLLTPSTYSALHRLQTDEVFHYYLGDPLRMLHLLPDGTAKTLVLGPKVLDGHHLQVVVPRGVWQGSLLEPGGKFALMGCTVAPGFDYADYEAGSRQSLLAAFPAYADLINRLTPE